MRVFRVWLMTGGLVGVKRTSMMCLIVQQASEARDMQGGVQSHERVRVRVLSDYLHALNSGHVELKPAQ